MDLNNPMDKATYDRILENAEEEGFVTTGSEWNDDDDVVIRITQPTANPWPTLNEVAADFIFALIMAIITLAYAFGQAAVYTDPDFGNLWKLCLLIFGLSFTGLLAFQMKPFLRGILDDIVLNAAGALFIAYAVILAFSVTDWQVPTPFEVFPNRGVTKVSYDGASEDAPEIVGISYDAASVTFPEDDGGSIVYFYRVVGENDFKLLTAIPPKEDVIEVVGMTGNKQVTKIKTLRRNKAK